MITVDTALPAILKLLADPTRLRILALLEREELSVGELGRCMSMAQSRVSNHLRLLREAQLLAERHVGTTTHLRIADTSDGHNSLSRVWQALRSELDALPEHAADRVRLSDVLAKRKVSAGFFDRVATDWDKIAGDFSTGQGRQRLVTHLIPSHFVIADLGCGTGSMSEPLLGQCDRLICVDGSEAMLSEASKRLNGISHQTTIEYRAGELNALPIAEAEVDGVVCGMVLHHLPEMSSALKEMLRVLKPGGSAAIMELAPHKEAWMQAELGDRHLGLQASDVMTAFSRIGFEEVVLDPVADHYQPTNTEGQVVSLPLFIVRGRKPLRS